MGELQAAWENARSIESIPKNPGKLADIGKRVLGNRIYLFYRDAVWNYWYKTKIITSDGIKTEYEAVFGDKRSKRKMNRVVLMGRLTRDPNVTYTQGERPMAVAKYTLAVDRRGQKSQDGGQTADFINCVAFDRAGEFAEKYFRQGMRVLVSGRLQTGSYTNKEGRKVYTTQVILDDQEFADSKVQGSKAPETRSTEGLDMGDGFMNIPDGVEDEGLPFA